MGNRLVTVVISMSSVKVKALEKNSVNVSVLLKKTSLSAVKVMNAVTLTVLLAADVLVTVMVLVIVSLTVATHFSVTVHKNVSV